MLSRDATPLLAIPIGELAFGRSTSLTSVAIPRVTDVSPLASESPLEFLTLPF